MRLTDSWPPLRCAESPAGHNPTPTTYNVQHSSTRPEHRFSRGFTVTYGCMHACRPPPIVAQQDISKWTRSMERSAQWLLVDLLVQEMPCAAPDLRRHLGRECLRLLRDTQGTLVCSITPGVLVQLISSQACASMPERYLCVPAVLVPLKVEVRQKVMC